MGFVNVPGLTGKVYVPDAHRGGACKKHPCPDCFACQNCGDDRCRLCRGQGCPSRTGPTIGKESPHEG